MKKFLILLLTFITLVSVLSISAFADENGAMIPYEASEPVISKNVESDNESSIPTIGAIEESFETTEEENEDGVGGVELKFTTDNVKTSLTHMGLGLLGVMIVLGLIAIVVVVLNKFSNKKE